MARGTRKKREFAVCVNNRGYEASLEAGKLYRLVPDARAEAHGYMRVIDESGEDYGYSADRFFRIEIPAALAAALTRKEAERRTPRRP